MLMRPPEPCASPPPPPRFPSSHENLSWGLTDTKDSPVGTTVATTVPTGRTLINKMSNNPSDKETEKDLDDNANWSPSPISSSSSTYFLKSNDIPNRKIDEKKDLEEDDDEEEEGEDISSTSSEDDDNIARTFDDDSSLNIGEICKVIYVCTRKVGYLVGHQGRTIWGFEKNSGAKIDILTPNSKNDETPVRLSGPPQSVKSVIRMIMDLYHQNTLSSKLWFTPPHPSSSSANPNAIIATEEIKIPKYCIPSIVGPRGETIEDMEIEYGVKIVIGRHEESNCKSSSSIDNNIPIDITGTGTGIRKTIKNIKDYVEEFRYQAIKPLNNHHYIPYNYRGVNNHSRRSNNSHTGKFKMNNYSLSSDQSLVHPSNGDKKLNHLHQSFSRSNNDSSHKYFQNNTQFKRLSSKRSFNLFYQKSHSHYDEVNDNNDHDECNYLSDVTLSDVSP